MTGSSQSLVRLFAMVFPPQSLFCQCSINAAKKKAESIAEIWAGNARPEYLQYLMTVDVHSPNEARVNGALPMVDSWYKAFNIKKGDKLFVPKNKRAHIW